MTHNPKYADPKLSEAIAGAQDTIFHKLTKPKSRIEAALTVDYTDDQDRTVTIFYMVDDIPLSHQTDVTSDAYVIEAVIYKKRRVKLSSRGEQHLLEWLNSTNPQQSRFSERGNTPPDWWLDNYTDASGNCYSDADEGL